LSFNIIFERRVVPAVRSGMFAPTNSDGADPGLQRVFFSPATNFAAGDLPHSLTIGDFNGDGKRIWRYQI
jgi:hypothetical protein